MSRGGRETTTEARTLYDCWGLGGEDVEVEEDCVGAGAVAVAAERVCCRRVKRHERHTDGRALAALSTAGADLRAVREVACIVCVERCTRR